VDQRAFLPKPYRSARLTSEDDPGRHIPDPKSDSEHAASVEGYVEQCIRGSSDHPDDSRPCPGELTDRAHHDRVQVLPAEFQKDPRGTGRRGGGFACRLSADAAGQDRVGPGPGSVDDSRGEIRDGADDQVAIPEAGDRARRSREAGRVIERAVDRVDDPLPAIGPTGAALLLTEESVPGEAGPDLVAEEALDQPVGWGDDVERVALSSALRAGGRIGRDLQRGRRPVEDGFER